MVLPDIEVKISEGLKALPFTRFSVSGVTMTTFTGSFWVAMALKEARVAAAPPMSEYILSMPLAGLRS